MTSRLRWTLTTLTALACAPAPARAELSEQEILARFTHEPTVQQVQDAAIRYYQVHPERISSLRTNAQLKALVPNVQGGFLNSLSTNRRKMNDGLYSTLPFKEDATANEDIRAFSISASWTLDRLVFNAEVLDVQSLIGILDGVVREVTTIYYIRRRLQIDNILRPSTDFASKISQTIRVEELTGLLDAMTGGFMSKSIRKAKRGESSAVPAHFIAAAPTPVMAPRGLVTGRSSLPSHHTLQPRGESAPSGRDTAPRTTKVTARK